MSTAVKITCDEFEAMIARGEFAVDDPRRYELIDGEIVEMSPANPPHERAIDIFTEWSFENLPKRAVWTRVQQSVGTPRWRAFPSRTSSGCGGRISGRAARRPTKFG